MGSVRNKLEEAGEQEGWGNPGKSSFSLFSTSASAFGLGGDQVMRGGREKDYHMGSPKGYDYTAPLHPATPEEWREVSLEEKEKWQLQQAKRRHFQRLHSKWETSEQELERLSRRVDEERVELAHQQALMEDDEVVSPRNFAKSSVSPVLASSPPLPLPVPPVETKEAEMVKELRMLRMANA